MPLAVKGQEAWGEAPTSLLHPSSGPSLDLRAGEQEEGKRVGWVLSNEGVLVINGSGMAPFFSIAP